MKTARISALLLALSLALTPALRAEPEGGDEGFVSIFNGKDLTGWKPGTENPASFSVKDGMLIIDGPRCHLFYMGEDGQGVEFTNFKLKLKAMTQPNSNSGVYFHTQYQEENWPDLGYECQVNSTHKDPKKTGSLYAVVNMFASPDDEEAKKGPYVTVDNKTGASLHLTEAPSKDNEWFDYDIQVLDGKVTLKVNGKTTVEYVEPEDGTLPNAKMPGRKLGKGTIAIQAHDPDSVVYYKDIFLKILDK